MFFCLQGSRFTWGMRRPVGGELLKDELTFSPSSPSTIFNAWGWGGGCGKPRATPGAEPQVLHNVNPRTDAPNLLQDKKTIAHVICNDVHVMFFVGGLHSSLASPNHMGDTRGPRLRAPPTLASWRLGCEFRLGC